MDAILTSITDLFLGNGIIIVIGCFIVGMFLKGSVKKLSNKYIPYINVIVAIILGFIIPGTFDDEFIVSKIIILSFLGLSSVGLYEAICVVVKERFSINIHNIYNNNLNDNNSKESQTQEDEPKNNNNEEWL